MRSFSLKIYDIQFCQEEIKMKKIKLLYYNGKNFGDALSPFIVSQITHNQHIIQKSRRIIFKKYYIKFIIINLLKGNFKLIKSILLPHERNLIAIGSVLSLGNKYSDIWGSGFMNENEKFNGGTIYALRGKLSLEKIQKFGIFHCETFGDPGMLLPRFIRPSSQKKYQLGIVPHFKETQVFQKEYPNYPIINLNTTKIKETVEEITQCHYILSTSLHGIIVAHSYGIPALWIKKGEIDTDGFKFKDYFSSVDIEAYEGIKDFDYYITKNKWMELFEKYKLKSLPQKDISIIQEELLECFPKKYISE